MVDKCRVCRGTALNRFLDLGETALANRFVHPDHISEPEPTLPLRVSLCDGCGLVQIDEEADPQTLFGNYLYVSGTSDAVHAHAANLAEHFVRHCPLAPGDLVVEAASNDGTMLRAFQPYQVRALGIEPAKNIAELANAAAVETLCEFFNTSTAERIRARLGPAKLVLARHVLAHVRDLHGFVRGIAFCLAKDGLAAAEVPHLLRLYENLEYDTIYHEHLCYFSLHVLKQLFERFELELVDVAEVEMHGGSILVSIQHRGGPHRQNAAVDRILREESRRGLTRLENWQRFALRVAQSRKKLISVLDDLRARGRRLAGYGAPAKGMTLLSYCGIGPGRLPYLVDRSPFKQGLLTPGHHIPVHRPERLLTDRPDVVLLLAWNYADEIVRQQAAYLRGGGRFLVPIPIAHYVNSPIGVSWHVLRRAG
jgi:hypothetical protein